MTEEQWGQDAEWMFPPDDVSVGPDVPVPPPPAPGPWTAPGSAAPQPGQLPPGLPWQTQPGAWGPTGGYLPPAGPYGAPAGNWVPPGVGAGPGDGSPPGGPDPAGGPGASPWNQPWGQSWGQPWGAPSPRAPARTSTTVLVVLGVVAVLVLLVVTAALIPNTDERDDPFLSPQVPFGPSGRSTVNEGFRVVWSVPLGAAGLEPAVLDPDEPRVGIWDDTLVLITESGQAVGYDVRTGDVRWVTTPERDGTGTTETVPRGGAGAGRRGPGTSSGRTFAQIDGMRVSGGSYVMVQKYGSGFAVDPATGEVLWSLTGSFFYAGPTFPDTFTRQSGSMVRHGHDPDEQWSIPMSGSEISWSVTSGDDTAVFGTGESVKGVDRASGKERWTVRAPQRTVQDVEATDGKVMVLSPQGGVVALDLDTGDEVWTSTADSPGAELAAIGADMIVVHDAFEGMIALDTATGATRWTGELEGWGFTRGRVGERTVILADAEGFAAFDRSSGARVAERSGADLIGTGATDGNRVCFLSTARPESGTTLGTTPGSTPGTAGATTSTARRATTTSRPDGAVAAGPYLSCAVPVL